MKVAFKTWGEMPENPLGLPAEWPAECVEIKEDAAVPEGFRLVENAAYAAYREEYRQLYEGWEESVGKRLDEKRKEVREELRILHRAHRTMLDLQAAGMDVVAALQQCELKIAEATVQMDKLSTAPMELLKP